MTMRHDNGGRVPEPQTPSRAQRVVSACEQLDKCGAAAGYCDAVSRLTGFLCHSPDADYLRAFAACLAKNAERARQIADLLDAESEEQAA